MLKKRVKHGRQQHRKGEVEEGKRDWIYKKLPERVESHEQERRVKGNAPDLHGLRNGLCVG
jgi:hypothetical protein